MNSNSDTIPGAAIARGSDATRQRWRTRLWWLTGICILIAIGVTASSLRAPGETIVVHFRDGYGIKPGDTLRYRGIDVGSVTEVHLAGDMQGIDVTIQLAPEHKLIAVEGSQFWIERPRLRLGQVSGLETVLGAKYVGTIPGNLDGPRQREFTGLENPLGTSEQDSVDVRIRFPAGEGLGTGDAVRYRGIDVGEVTYVELDKELDSVWVGVRLVGAARQLASRGTQFWIERPRLEISEIRGLETLIGGRYLALEPSRGATVAMHEFVGLSEAPPLARREGSLELELEAHSRLGLVRGAPITYRGLEVGRVADVGLASDGASVTVQLIVEPEYSELVRKNSVWWSTGGVRLDAGLTGVNLSVDSFTSWLRGGISFATPDPPGDKVVTGYRFGLAEKPDPEWLKWQPRIATGASNLAGNESLPLPRVVRVAASWQSSFLGFARRQSAQAWCLPLDNGQVCLPYSLVKAAQSAKGAVNLEIAGSSSAFEPAKVTDAAGVALLPLSKDIKVQRWPVAKIAKERWNGRTDLLVINPELSEPMPLDASRGSGTNDGRIEINAAVPIYKSLEGSAVIEASTGQLLGLLISFENGWSVVAVHPRS
jgi:paraquat-inducible protein B